MRVTILGTELAIKWPRLPVGRRALPFILLLGGSKYKYLAKNMNFKYLAKNMNFIEFTEKSMFLHLTGFPPGNRKFYM